MVYSLYKTLTNYFIQGHTIVGDGTTAQISAIFAGELEDKLPEARKGYPKSGMKYHFCLF